jgi:hypothetical protein
MKRFETDIHTIQDRGDFPDCLINNNVLSHLSADVQGTIDMQKPSRAD